MLLAPLLPYLDLANPPTVMASSGYSGAGTKSGPAGQDGFPTTVSKIVRSLPLLPVVKVMLLTRSRAYPFSVPKDPASLRNAIKPYSLTDHIHEREASFQLSKIAPSPFQLAFVPTVGPWYAGIISMLSAPLKQTLRASEVRELYEKFYEGQKLVTLLPATAGVVDVRDVEGTHGWTMGGLQVHSSGKRVVAVGALDNLLKGAATQCLQNLNLALGYDGAFPLALACCPTVPC